MEITGTLINYFGPIETASVALAFVFMFYIILNKDKFDKND